MLCDNCKSIFTGKLKGERENERAAEDEEDDYDVFKLCGCAAGKAGEDLPSASMSKTLIGANDDKSSNGPGDEDCHLCVILKNQISAEEREEGRGCTNMDDKHWLWNSMVDYEVEQLQPGNTNKPEYQLILRYDATEDWSDDELFRLLYLTEDRGN